MTRMTKMLLLNTDESRSRGLISTPQLDKNTDHIHHHNPDEEGGLDLCTFATSAPAATEQPNTVLHQHYRGQHQSHNFDALDY